MAETKRGRLLIVDDETELKSALCETLADEGYETVGASNGAEGLKALERQDFDLLLSDLMMPGMNGIELLRKALQIDPQYSYALNGLALSNGAIKTQCTRITGRNATGYGLDVAKKIWICDDPTTALVHQADSLVANSP